MDVRLKRPSQQAGCIFFLLISSFFKDLFAGIRALIIEIAIPVFEISIVFWGVKIDNFSILSL